MGCYTVYPHRYVGVFAAKDFVSTSYTTETVDTPANLTRNSVDMLFKYPMFYRLFMMKHHSVPDFLPCSPSRVLGCLCKLGSMVSKWALTYILINGVYSGYNPLILTIDPQFRPATSKYQQVANPSCLASQVAWSVEMRETY